VGLWLSEEAMVCRESGIRMNKGTQCEARHHKDRNLYDEIVGVSIILSEMF